MQALVRRLRRVVLVGPDGGWITGQPAGEWRSDLKGAAAHLLPDGNSVCAFGGATHRRVALLLGQVQRDVSRPPEPASPGIAADVGGQLIRHCLVLICGTVASARIARSH